MVRGLSASLSAHAPGVGMVRAAAAPM